jgi:hypothetical protein
MFVAYSNQLRANERFSLHVLPSPFISLSWSVAITAQARHVARQLPLAMHSSNWSGSTFQDQAVSVPEAGVCPLTA